MPDPRRRGWHWHTVAFDWGRLLYEVAERHVHRLLVERGALSHRAEVLSRRRRPPSPELRRAAHGSGGLEKGRRVMTFASLHHGIDIPECGVLVPWLVTPEELCKRLSSVTLATSPAGWPRLRFTCLGLTAEFGFNFVAHPECRLVGVRLDESFVGSEQQFQSDADRLRARLGAPNAADRSEHLMWRDSRVWVNYALRAPDGRNEKGLRSLNVHFHAGVPRAWVPPGERGLGEVKRLLELLPGVKVVRVWCPPRGTSVDLTVGWPQSLAWLAHAMCANNVLFQVGVDWYRLSNRGTLRAEASDVVYQVELPGPRTGGPGEPLTGLQTLGISLVRELQERRVLKEQEATYLLELFHYRGERGNGLA